VNTARSAVLVRVALGLGGLALCLVLLVAIWVGLLFFPQPFFDKKLGMGDLVLYADGASGTAFESEAREALRRLAAIEGLEPGRRIRVFFCGSQRRYAFFAKLARVHPLTQGFGLYYAGSVFVSEAGLAASAGKAVPHSRLEGAVAHVIAHEAAHFVLVREFGFRASRALPVWKSEGFADWAATRATRAVSPKDDYRTRLGILLDDEHWPPGENHLRDFLRWQLLAEFHFDIANHSREEFFNPALREAQLWGDLSRWMRIEDGP